MKDLNRAEVYDLRGITHEQAEELLQWLIKKEEGWNFSYLNRIKEYKYLTYLRDSWYIGNCYDVDPTTNISTLFDEQSYEEQLIEALKRVETLKAKIKEQKQTKL